MLMTDLEHRNQVEEALPASERDLVLIINTIPALAWSALPDGSAEFFNQHYLDYIGFTQEQAKGVGWTAAVHPQDLPGLAVTWQLILASEKPGEAEARLRRFDGQYRWWLFRAGPLRDDSGRIVKWYGTNTDIDDRKRAEDELRRSEAILTEGERLNSSGSFCWRPDSQEITFSEQARRIFEFDRETLVTLGLLESRVHPEDRGLLAEKVALSRKDLYNHSFEYRLQMPSGAIKYLRMNTYGTRDRGGHLEYVGAMQDVTERRLADEALGKVRSELAHMTRVASFGALTASIAHEVNQPLSGIITNANTCLRMLSADPPNVDGAVETARRTIRDGNRASDVIARLRALFAKKGATVEGVDLNEATREVLALSRSELQQERAIVRTALDDELPIVRGDRLQLQQVILNLVLNALAAMAGVDDRPRELSITTHHDADDLVRLTVRDAGVGLDPQRMDQLFEAFYMTKTTGMGLGLSVSRSIVESHGGRLWAETNEGPGATFSFSIPSMRTSSDGEAPTAVAPNITTVVGFRLARKP
jgi:PAS domain S-box-containing protein